MRAAVRTIYSADEDLDCWVPDQPEDVGLAVRMIIGPAEGPGEESFDVMICTPRWLAREVHRNGPLIGRHHVIVERWDFPRIRRFLVNAVERQEAPTWGELGEQIGRIGYWEFEDHQPYSPG